MKIRDEIKTVQWITKVIESCKTKEQYDNAVKLSKLWLKRNEARCIRGTSKTWDNFLSLGHYMADICKAKKKELGV